MNIPDHISEKQSFGLKYLKSLMRMQIRIRDPGIFFTLLRDAESGIRTKQSYFFDSPTAKICNLFTVLT
jgi:hypothetical protein